jgi:hypothetical protein
MGAAVPAGEVVKKLWCYFFHRRYWYPVDSNSVLKIIIYSCGECGLSHAARMKDFETS